MTTKSGDKRNVYDFFAAVHQGYQTPGPVDEYVILGNDALVKCTVPSYISDFVSVVGWVDSEGNDFHPSSSLGKSPCDARR